MAYARPRALCGHCGRVYPSDVSGSLCASLPFPPGLHPEQMPDSAVSLSAKPDSPLSRTQTPGIYSAGTMPSLCGFLPKGQSAPDPSHLCAFDDVTARAPLCRRSGAWWKRTCPDSCGRHLEGPRLPSIGLSPGPASASSTASGRAEASGRRALVEPQCPRGPPAGPALREREIGGSASVFGADRCVDLDILNTQGSPGQCGAVGWSLIP